MSKFLQFSQVILADVIVHRQPQQTQNELVVIPMNKTGSNHRDEIGGYETLTTNTQEPPADDDAGSVYDLIPDSPKAYQALRGGEDNTGTNNIQEQQPTRSSPDDEGNVPEPPPPRGNIASSNIQEQPTDHPMYLELLDDEGNIASNNIQEQPTDHPMYLELLDDEGNIASNNIQEQPTDHPMYLELLDDEGNIASNNIHEQPTDHPMYLELLDDEGKAPDVREDIHTSSV